MSILVTKADGTKEPFVVKKLENSLRNAGAGRSEVAQIVSEIQTTLHDGIKTEVIYKRAIQLLGDHQYPVAARYSLRKALFGLDRPVFHLKIF